MRKTGKLLQLHSIILLWGFTPVLGKLITLQALDLVWYRLLIAGLALLAYALYKGMNLKVSWKLFGEIFGVGVIVGVHWYTFYHAIKVSNVSITMAGFSTITVFASLLQPVLLKKRFFWGDLIYGLIVCGALLFILNVELEYAAGIFYGVLSAFTGALFGIYNGVLVKKENPVKITLIEFFGAFVLLNLMIFLFDGKGLVLPDVSDTIFLLILSLFCTALAFTWSIEILKQFTPLTVIMTNNLEPVYGIVFSVLLFGSSEYMSSQFYVGAAIILLGVFTYPFVQKKFQTD